MLQRLLAGDDICRCERSEAIRQAKMDCFVAMAPRNDDRDRAWSACGQSLGQQSAAASAAITSPRLRGGAASVAFVRCKASCGIYDNIDERPSEQQKTPVGSGRFLVSDLGSSEQSQGDFGGRGREPCEFV